MLFLASITFPRSTYLLLQISCLNRMFKSCGWCRRVAAKLPSFSATLKWHQGSEEFESSGLLMAKWFLARVPSPSLQRERWARRGGRAPNVQDKLKSQPAILLLTSIDAIKQENGAWRPLHDYSTAFTRFPPGIESKPFWLRFPGLRWAWGSVNALVNIFEHFI